MCICTGRKIPGMTEEVITCTLPWLPILFCCDKGRRVTLLVLAMEERNVSLGAEF